MPSTLFSPITIAGAAFANRIVISPMCQYSANDGAATDWHLAHLGMLCGSGAGLVIVEATDIQQPSDASHPEPRSAHGEELGIHAEANSHDTRHAGVGEPLAHPLGRHERRIALGMHVGQEAVSAHDDAHAHGRCHAPAPKHRFDVGRDRIGVPE